MILVPFYRVTYNIPNSGSGGFNAPAGLDEQEAVQQCAEHVRQPYGSVHEVFFEATKVWRAEMIKRD